MMTPREQAVLRDLRAKLRLSQEKVLQVETELADARLDRLREMKTRSKAVARGRNYRRQRDEAVDTANFFHGILILNDIEIPEPLNGRLL